jgi:MBG domain
MSSRMKRGVAWCIAAMLSAGLAYADVNVLIIGSTKDSADNASISYSSDPFVPTTIKTELVKILSGAGMGAVNVTLEDRYHTTSATVDTYNTQTYSYNLVSWFYWPYPAGTDTQRWANLRGEAGTKWNYVVLIGDPYTIEYTPGVYALGVGKIGEEVAKGTNGAETVLLMAWPAQNSTSTVAHYKEVVYRAGRTGRYKIAPAGIAWESAGKPASGSSSPNADGAYIAAATIFSTITGQSATNSTYSFNATYAGHAYTAVTNNLNRRNYSGHYTKQNPYLMLDDKRRYVKFSHKGTSTESRFTNEAGLAMWRAGVGCDAENRNRYSSNTPEDDGMGWPTGTPMPIAWNHGRHATGENKDWVANPAYWQIGLGIRHQPFLSTDDINAVGVEALNDYFAAVMFVHDFVYAHTYGSTSTFRDVPARTLWTQIHQYAPNEAPMTDSDHNHSATDRAVGNYMYTLYSGRCPVDGSGLSPEAIGYQTAWRVGTGSSRAPGFKVLPTSFSATNVTPTNSQTLSVYFLYAPTSNVTVTVSVDDPLAGIATPSVLTFTPSNYANAQTVTVTGESGFAGSYPFNVILTTSSGDAAYDELSDSWDFMNTRPNGQPPSGIRILGKGLDQITTGDMTPSISEGTGFGFTSSSVTNTFTITNMSATVSFALTNSPRVTVTGSGGHFALVQDAGVGTLVPGASTTFKIKYQPLSVGMHTGIVSVASTDSLLPLYTFAIDGIKPTAPSVISLGGTANDATSANLSGQLSAGGGADAWICWGGSDGGTSSTSGWDHVVSAGTAVQGINFSSLVSGLATNRTYWYRCYVSNPAGSSWSAVASFSGKPAGGGGTPGLWYGEVSGGSIDTATPNPRTLIETNVASRTEDSIGGNTTEIYTGYIFDGDGQISFTEDIDDRTRIWIDGSLVVASDSWSDRISTANLNLAPGWHAIEVRIFNASGGSGPHSSPGIGYDPNGGTSWQTLQDSGAGTFLNTTNAASIDNLAPTGITATAATLNGTLHALGTNYAVYVYYGMTDGGTNAGSWATNALVGSGINASINVSRNVSLLSGTTNYYTFMASNNAGVVWASPSWKFKMPGSSDPNQPAINNSDGATGITMTNALLVGTLTSTGNSPTTVTCYWKANSDPGQTTTGWDYSRNFGVASSTGAYTNDTAATAPLSPGTTYYYRYRAANSYATNWSEAVSFTALVPPTVDNATGATSLSATSATLRGELTAGANADAWICWGLSDAGTGSTGSWNNVISIGSVSQGVIFSNTVSSLATNTTYFYRCYVVNSAGMIDWSDTAAAFSGTPPSGGGGGVLITAPTDSIKGFTNTVIGGNSTDGVNWPAAQGPTNAIDGSVDTKYLNYGKVGSGFYITPGTGTTMLTDVRVYTADDSSGRDPLTVSIEGANGGVLSQGSSWTLISNSVNLGINTWPGYKAAGPLVSVKSATTYTSYRVIVQSLRTASEDSAQYSEFRLYGFPGGGSGSIANLAPTGVTDTQAVLNASLDSSGANCNIYVYYGTSNGGTNAGSWATNAFVGSWTNVSTNVSKTVSLASGTTNYYTFMASNATKTVWAAPSWQFKTPDSFDPNQPAINSSDGATGITDTQALLRGTLTSTGSSPTTVTCYWKANSDPGQTTTGWDYNSNCGIASSTRKYTTDTVATAALQPGTLYYYRYRAANSHGTNWSEAISFTTLDLPTVDNATGAKSLSKTSAVLFGELTAGIGANAWICWGLSDAGTGSTGDWDNVVSIGSVSQGVIFSNKVSSLAPNTTYFYRCYVSNAAGADWSDTATAFSGADAFSQDFEGGGTPYTLTQRAGSTPAAVLAAGGTGIDNYLRLVAAVGSTRNEIAFDQAGGQDNPGDSTTIEFDFRMSGVADGWGILLIPTATYGTSGTGANVSFSEEPNLANTFAIGYDIYSNIDEASLHWNGINLTNVNLKITSPTFDLNNDKWHHAKIELKDPGPASDVQVTYTLTSDIHGTPGTPLVVWNNYTVTGMTSLYSYRVECSARTGGSTHRTDLDNFKSFGSAIANRAPTGITDAQADLKGWLYAPGANYDVYVCYGATDGGTNAGSWITKALVGSWTNVSTNASYNASVIGGTTYYYTFMASNSTEVVWAAPSWQFTTLGAPNTKITPTVTNWPSASPITYGQALSAATLSGGSASVSGVFSYNSPATIPNAGTYSAAVTFMPNDTANYNGVAGNVNVAVSKATPSVTNWPTASAIEVGQAVSTSILTGGSASVGGSFAFENPTLTPPLGTNSVNVVFTPVDPANYNAVTGSVSVVVVASIIPVTVTLSNLSQTYNGSARSVTVTTEPSGLTVTVTYNISSVAPTNAGSYVVLATVTQSGYAGATNGTLIISKVTPAVTNWPTASNPILVGQAISNAPLTGGSASVPGSFSYVAPGTVPPVGVYTAGVAFAATDSLNYRSVTGTVAVTVNPLPPSAPTGLVAVPSIGQVSLSWNPSTNATSYNVKRAASAGGPYATIGTTAATNYVDTTVSNGATYFYVVSALNVSGESADSSPVSAQLPRVLPFAENFEARNLGDLNGQNNWLSLDAVVQTNRVIGTKAGRITSETGFASQSFAGSQTHVWTDFMVQPVLYVEPPAMPDPPGTVMLYFNAAGHPVVYSNAVPVELAGVTIATGTWTRVTIRSDYVNRKWDLYLNAVKAATNLAFSATDESFTYFEVKGGGSSTSFALDELTIGLQSPWPTVNKGTLILFHF